MKNRQSNSYDVLNSQARARKKEEMRVKDWNEYMFSHQSASSILKKNAAFSEEEARHAVIHFS